MTDVPALRSFAMNRETLAISLGQYSAAGRKEENQDFHGALVPEGPDLASKGIACAIADGISTSLRGAEAAEIAVKSFLTDYYCTSDGWSARRAGETVISASNSWMHAQNTRIRPLEEGDRERSGLICTFSGLILKSRSAHILHVGDSRIARLSGQSLEPLTTDHQVSIGGGQTYLGRALGADATVEIEYRQTALEVGDIFVLTTDGVHEFIDGCDIDAALKSAPDVNAAARTLAELALERGSDDNVTIQLVRIDSLPLGEVDDLLGSQGLPPLATAPAEGAQIDGYRLIEPLHAGSRSSVWRARHREDDRDVALKLPATERQDAEALSQLMLEEWVMRRLSHPALLSAAPQHGPRTAAYCVAELVEGRTLSQVLQQDGPLPLAEVRRIVSRISAGIEAMHRREMLHRDLRPHNVMLGDDGRVTIIDFGSTLVAGLEEVAPRPYEDAAFAGTMQFGAPELFLGRPASAASDTFSLGTIAYTLLTGKLPYGTRVSAARTPAQQRRLRYSPAAGHVPDIPGWVDAALAKATAINPRRRYASPAEFVQDLANPNHALPVPEATSHRIPARTWRTATLILAALLALSILTRPDVRDALGLSLSTQETRP